MCARYPPNCAGQWSGGTDWLRRLDQADLERRDLPWLRRSRPLMLDMRVSGLRDIAAGMFDDWLEPLVAATVVPAPAPSGRRYLNCRPQCSRQRACRG